VYQFDFSHEHVELGGVDQVIKLAHVQPCHRRALFLVAYPARAATLLPAIRLYATDPAFRDSYAVRARRRAPHQG
jgi:hypothetical protein